MKLNKVKIIQTLISLALLAFIVNKIGFHAILDTFKSINILYLPIIAFLYLITLILGGIDLWILLRPFTKNIPLYRVITYSMLSWAVGLFTPGKIGEFSVAYLLSREGLEIGKGIAVALIDKFITLLTLIVCSESGMFVIIGSKYTFLMAMALLSLFVMMFLLLFVIRKINSIRRTPWLGDLQGALAAFFKKNKRLLAINALLTTVKWCITGLAFYVVFASFGNPASVLFIIAISMTISIVNIIPITLHGLGLKEVAAVYLYGMIGVPQEIAVVTSLFFSMFAYGIGFIILVTSGNLFHGKSRSQKLS